MNPINPYRRNCEVMRKFFSKPIFLLIAVVFSLSILSDIVTSVFYSSFNISFLYILPVIAFFMFYFKSRSRSPLVSFNAPITLMKVYSIINIVIMGLLMMLSLLVLITSASSFSDNSYLTYELSTLYKNLAPLYLLVFAPQSIVYLLSSIAMLTMFSSFKRSISSIYLQRKGSIFLAITSIAVVVYYIYIYAIAITLTLINDVYSNLIDYMLSYSYNTVGVNISVVTSFIEYGFEIIIGALFAVLGFSYNSYIKKLSTSINTEYIQNHFSAAPTVSDTPNSEYSPVSMRNNTPDIVPQKQPPANIWSDSVPVSVWNQTPAPHIEPAQVQQKPPANPIGSPMQTTPPVKPVEFDPKPVFNTENPYAKNDTDNVNIPVQEQPNSKFCPNCGKENSSDCMFCGGCGTKL